MVLGIMYLGVVVLALVGLVRLKYYRLWPLLTVQIAVTAWQAAIIAFVPLSDGTIPTAARRGLAIHWWLPGDVLLVVVTAAAVMEGLWRALGDFPVRHKVGMEISQALGLVFVGLCLRWLLDVPHSQDWFRQIQNDRVIVNLCLAGAAIMAFGLAETFLRRADPRYVRMHVGMLATLAIGHVVFADLTHWSASRNLYRALQCVCLLGWFINASLLGLEIEGLHTPVRAGVATPHSPAPPAEAEQSHALVAPAVPVYRQAGLPERVWPPVIRAGR